MDQFFFYQNQDRSPKQIQLTNHLSRALTTINLKRIQQRKNIQIQTAKHDYLYVCFAGLPPVPQQFDNIGIPGEKMVIYYQGYEPGISQEEAKQKVKCSRLQQQAAIIHQRLNKRKDKPLVFIYHSFGTILAATLLRLYYSDYVNRVIGFIGIGFFTLRFTNFLKSGIEVVSKDRNIDFLIDNIDYIYNKAIERYKKYNVPNHDKNKYTYLCRVVALTQGLGFKEMFSYLRQFPPVLKCFIYGREDTIMSEQLLNQVPIYYSYKQKLQPAYEQKIRKVIKEEYGMNIDNAQQRFVFNIPEGKHSIHAQKRFSNLIGNIVNEYLDIIVKINK